MARPRALEYAQGLCADCGEPMPDACRELRCLPCQTTADQRAAAARLERQVRPVHVTHIAGYVPPRGSIAWTLLGCVVPPR